MFSRRHPYLFFLLVFSGIVCATVLIVSLMVYAGIKGSGIGDLIASDGGTVGVIEITGVIQDSRGALDDLKRFREDKAVKAIVMRIDSPGGAVGPSQEIYRELRKTVRVKTVVASMGTVAASGGYYIAAGADKIMANPGTLTGSIGVIMGFANYQALLEKIGLVPIVVKSGEYKDMGSPTRDMTPQEREIFQSLARKIHDQFVSDIASGRGMELAAVETIADGRIFTGEESESMGLVDRLGNFEDAVEWAGRLGGIQGSIKTVYARDKRLTFLEYLLMDTRLKAAVDRFLSPGPRAEAILDPSRS